ncbi:hypothetical protein [Chitinophaga barathri]|uniref:Uncharacterized protein n=1 Tax=Chitinophaga barathri TaxID=1647451 RepID=A0A3N4M667_9BACT|nr:hypothetical protein [Chitinophaga barathri]RPD38834.1 hypothetical protein EG028_22035 [Chitinophaga barathri]
MYTSELDELILVLESEKANLEVLIQEALKESDYLFAATCKKGLCRVNKTLENLQYFKDPYMEEKRGLEKMIGWFEERGALRGYNNPNPDLSALKTRLEELLNKSTWITPNENELTEALYDLIEGKNAGFRLHLLKKQGFFIEFRLLAPGEIFISFPGKSAHPNQHNLPFDWKAMPRLGFQPNDDEGFERIYPYTGQGAVSGIKVLLAQLLYEHSNYIKYDSPSKIEFL